MKRGDRVRTAIGEIRKRIHSAEKSKKEFFDYLKKLKEAYSSGEISYSTYIESLYAKREGRNISEWIEYFDKYKKECGREIKKHQVDIVKRQFVIIFFSAALIFSLLILSFYIQPKFVGFVIQEPKIISEINATITTTQEQAVLNQPVKWEKEIIPENIGELIITLPSQAENIAINKIKETPTEPLTQIQITGAVISTREGFLTRFYKNIQGKITGKVISEVIQEKQINFQIDEITNYEIIYETPAPYSIEEPLTTSRGKKITIVGPKSIHYENVLAFSELPKETSQAKIRLYRTTDGAKELTTISNYIDENNNGLIDKIEFIVPLLSEQTYELIIEISKAEHLDSNRQFISDIYEQVKDLDDIWSETIPDGHYVRVTFQENLTSDNDITLYPRTISGTPKIEVYEVDGNEVITEFTSIIDNEYNTAYLTNLIGSQDTFDLRIVGGSLEFDHIVDPIVVTSTGTNDIGMAPLDNVTFVIVYTNVSNNVVAFEIWNTTGQRDRGATVVDSTNTPATTTRVSVAAVNSTNFIIGWSNSTGTNTGTYLIAGYTRSTGATYFAKRAISISNLGSFLQDNELTIAGATLFYCYLNVTRTNATEVSRFNTTTGAMIGTRTIINAELGREHGRLNNTLSCDAVNQTTIVFAEYDDFADDDVTRHGVNTAGVEAPTDGDIDTAVGNYGQVAATGLNGGGFAVVYFDSNDQDITLAMNWTRIGTATFNSDIDSNVGVTLQNKTKVAIATVRNFSTNDDNVVVAWTNATDLVAAGYNKTGGQSMARFAVDPNPANSTLYLLGKEQNNQSICSGTWVIAYKNVSDIMQFKTYWLNGSTWDGTCVAPADTTKPNIRIIYPTNNSNFSFNTVDVNYTASDANLAYCWWSNDSRQNATITCGTNITTVIWDDGIHNISVWANDTAGNMNGSYVTFRIDTRNPQLTIVFPTNNTNTSNIQLNVNYTVYDNNGLSRCWYTNTSGRSNNTITCGQNITTVTWIQGINNVSVYANDTVGNVNVSHITFYVDTIAPSIQIVYPSNNTNTSNNQIDVNYTVYNGFSGCYYTNNSGLNNYTLTNCINITDITWGEGISNVSVYANDTVGNVNVSHVSFFVDTINPQISIVFPSNNTNTSNVGIDVNYTYLDNRGVSGCWYTNNSGLNNYTLTNCVNITDITWGQDISNVSVYVNDSSGNTNRSHITFYVDSIAPSINITHPINNSNFTFTRVTVNYTTSDSGIGLSTCWYTNDSGKTNNTLANCQTNITTIDWIQGINNISVYANDTVGNVNVSYITFTIDTMFPQFSNYWDNNATQEGTGTAYLNVTVLNTNGTVILQFDGTNYSASNNSGDANRFNVTITSLLEGTYPYNWTSYGNGSLVLFNISAHRYYTVNESADVAPEIIRVYNATMTPDPSFGLNAGPFSTGITINFTAYDINGDLNITTALINFSKINEELRQNASCQRIETSTTLANFTCNVTMFWYDVNGTWNIIASIYDNNTNYGTNTTQTFQVGLITGFDISPTNLTWNPFAPGMTNQTSTNDPLTLNNTGNNEITPGNIQINATHLVGETDNTKALAANNFSVSWQGNTGTCIGAACIECDISTGKGTNMSYGLYTNLTLANLTRGNFTINNNYTAQEQLYFCLMRTGSELTSQAYSTSAGTGTWTIRILLAVIIPASRRKKKKKQKRKTIEDDKLIETISLLTDELKEKYKLSKFEIMNLVIKELRKKYKINRKDIMELTEVKRISIPATIFSKQLGALESLVKYMKENLNMNYSEIAKELQRNERTIWSAYKKAKEKQKEALKIEKTDIFLPISIFENKELTILEAVVLYLKEKGFKFSEIAKLLERDQRNIWTIYSRAVKKLNKEK